jgi:glycosyltransferase involved in cell wall biosynthesis
VISFSIIVPVYKTEEYLDCCIKSVVEQSYGNFELILVDDGSPDNCGQMCDDWATKDSRIKVVHQSNGGLSAARNSGIKVAENDYLMFLDSDDRWTDNTVLESIAAYLKQTEARVLSFNYQKSFNGNIESPYFSEEILSSETSETITQAINKGTYVTGACNKAILRSLIVDNDLYFREGITSEDIDWTFRLALCGETFAFANVCVFTYRQLASSISHSTTPQKVECLGSNVKECVGLLGCTPQEKIDALKSFTAYQYGTLLFNVATLPKTYKRSTLLKDVREMSWLLSCSNNKKIRMLYYANRFLGLSGTLTMLQIRKRFLDLIGKGV